MFLNPQLQNFHNHTFLTYFQTSTLLYMKASFFLIHVLFCLRLYYLKFLSRQHFHTSKVLNSHRFWQLFKSLFSSSTLLIQNLNFSLSSFKNFKTSRSHSHICVSQLPHFCLTLLTSPLHISTTLLKFLSFIVPRVHSTKF